MLRKSRKLRNLGVLIALIALLVVIPQPSAAQLVPAGCDTTGIASLTLGGGSVPTVQPISGEETLSVDYNYEAAQGASITPVAIRFTIQGAPSWATITLDRSVIYVQGGDQEGMEDSGSITVTVSVAANAPAFERGRFKIEAEAEEGTCVTGADAESPEIVVTPGFLERWTTRFDQSILQFGQNTAFQIPMSVENNGNGAIEVEFSQIEREESRVDGRALDVVVPPGLSVVGSQAQGQENIRTFNVDVQTPFRNGYMNERFPLAIEAGGRSADQNDVELRPAVLRAVVQTQGVFVPGFEMATALLAVIGIAMIQMRRRSD